MNLLDSLSKRVNRSLSTSTDDAIVSKKDVSGVSGDTEYFNGTCWKRISSYTQDEQVLQYNEDGSSTLVTPEDYKHYVSVQDFYENDDEWLPTKMTGIHPVVIRTKSGLLRKPFSEILELLSSEGCSDSYFIPATTRMLDTDLSLTVSDSCIAKVIEGYRYNKIPKNSGASNFLTKVGFGKVTLSDQCFWLAESQRQQLLRGVLMLKEGYCADGCTKDTVFTKSNGLQDAQIVTSLAHVTSGFSKVDYDWCERRCNVHDGYTIKMLNNPQFSVSDIPSESYDVESPTDIITSFDLDKYHFVVPSHMVVFRRKGRIFVLGDC